MQTLSMRLRATLAGMLIVMLVASSSAASACEIRCGFFMSASGCHAGSEPSVAQRTYMATMPGMDGVDIMAQNAPMERVAVSDSHRCRHAVCAQQPGFVRDQKVSVVPTPTGVALLILNPPRLVLDPAAGGLPVRGPPSRQANSPVSLHTTIRV